MKTILTALSLAICLVVAGCRSSSSGAQNAGINREFIETLGITDLRETATFKVGPLPSTPMAEIRRLIFALALLDYPIAQDRFREAAGIPAEVKPSLGSTELLEGRNTIYWIWPLLRSDTDSYSIKAYYSSDTMQTTGRNPSITGAEIITSPANGPGPFTADTRDWPVAQLKVLLKKSGLSPKEFTAPERFSLYLEQVRREEREARKADTSPVPQKQ